VVAHVSIRLRQMQLYFRGKLFGKSASTSDLTVGALMEAFSGKRESRCEHVG
jgi:hypothetical protein